MTHIPCNRPLAHYRLRVVQADAATADVPASLARPALSFAATVAAIVLSPSIFVLGSFRSDRCCPISVRSLGCPTPRHPC